MQRSPPTPQADATHLPDSVQAVRGAQDLGRSRERVSWEGPASPAELKELKPSTWGLGTQSLASPSKGAHPSSPDSEPRAPLVCSLCIMAEQEHPNLIPSRPQLAWPMRLSQPSRLRPAVARTIALKSSFSSSFFKRVFKFPLCSKT